MKMYWGVEVYIHAFLAWTLDEGEGSASPRPVYPRGKSPPSCLDAVAKRNAIFFLREFNSQPVNKALNYWTFIEPEAYPHLA
jgi:hypothetical protein